VKKIQISPNNNSQISFGTIFAWFVNYPFTKMLQFCLFSVFPFLKKNIIICCSGTLICCSIIV